jgi:hypothetical protein
MLRIGAAFRTFSSVQCFRCCCPTMKGSTLFGALVVVLMRGWTALEASARSWRSLDEEVRTASYSSFSLLTA